MVVAKMIDTGIMSVEYLGTCKVFTAFHSWRGWEADCVFAAPIVRNGKDWPVSVVIADDGKVGYSIIYANRNPRSSSIRITGFWEDSQNKSRHNKI